MGRLRWFTAAVCVEAAANLLLSVSLVRWLGIEGVAWGTAIPNVCFNVALTIYICRLLEVSTKTLLWPGVIVPVCASCLAPAGWLLLSCFLPVTSWAAFLVVGFAGVTLHAAAAIILEWYPSRLGNLLSFRRRRKGENTTPSDGLAAGETI